MADEGAPKHEEMREEPSPLDEFEQIIQIWNRMGLSEEECHTRLREWGRGASDLIESVLSSTEERRQQLRLEAGSMNAAIRQIAEELGVEDVEDLDDIDGTLLSILEQLSVFKETLEEKKQLRTNIILGAPPEAKIT